MQQRKLSLLIASLLGSLTLAGCGSDSNSVYEPTPTPPPPPAPLVEFPVQDAAPQLTDLSETGVIFTAENGLSLYLFDNDEPGSSACNAEDGAPAGASDDVESCAAVWPPLLAGDGATASGPFSLIEREDGTSQWAWNSFPLYLFKDDSAEGEINGDTVNDAFHLARPTPLKAIALDDKSMFVGNNVVLSATSTADVLELFREDKDGFSLYIFDNDDIDTVNCVSDGCTSNWPPLMADPGARPEGKFSVIARGEEEEQWAYNGKPLYFFANDAEAGEINGDNVGNVFHVATNEAAIFRTNDAGTLLTATGKTDALVEETEDSGTFVVEQKNWDQFTLYTFANDEQNDSNCVDGCAVNWPAFIAQESDEDTGNLTKFTREDGHMQWAYKGQPLYFFINDTQKGEANGDGVANGLFNIIEAPIETEFVSESNDLGEVMTVDSTVLVLVSDGAGNSEQLRQDKTGFALYTFDNDEVEITNCLSDFCMGNWPALLASEDDVAEAPFSIFERSDGLNQWAVNGKPLYFFTNDETADDTNGEGIADAFYTAKPAPVRVFADEENGEFYVAHGALEPSVGKTSEELIDMTLYTFDSDEVGSGESSCLGGCTETWPPLYAAENDQGFGEFTIIERTETDDSLTRQWAYKGSPLYFHHQDASLGDTNGNYTGWQLARP